MVTLENAFLGTFFGGLTVASVGGMLFEGVKEGEKFYNVVQAIGPNLMLYGVLTAVLSEVAFVATTSAKNNKNNKYEQGCQS
jgi:hypothetical protein